MWTDTSIVIPGLDGCRPVMVIVTVDPGVSAGEPLVIAQVPVLVIPGMAFPVEVQLAPAIVKACTPLINIASIVADDEPVFLALIVTVY